MKVTRNMQTTDLYPRTGRATLTRIRNRSHTLSPISRLPLECLSHIFTQGSECGALTDQPKVAPESRMWPVKNTHIFSTTVSHVCHYWRNAALCIPQLWAFIDFSDPPPFNRTQLWLERSRSTPLVVSLGSTKMNEGTTDEIESMVKLLQPHLFRGCEIAMAFSHYYHMKLLLSALGCIRSTPKLVTLWLDAMSGLERIDGAEEKSLGGLGEEVFRGVRFLRLNRIYFPWDHPVYVGLVELSLSHMDMGILVPAQLETILRDCPSLELLRLRRVDYRVSWTHSSPTTPISTTSPIRMKNCRVFRHRILHAVAHCPSNYHAGTDHLNGR